MRKGTLIATCLVNCNAAPNMEDAEYKVKEVFEENFPHYSYERWNSAVLDVFAEHVIGTAKAYQPRNVLSLIQEL